MLIVEKEFQRIMRDPSFGFPYWQWEENDMSPFAQEYYGVPANVYGPPVNVSGDYINPENWNTVCDLIYFNGTLNCSSYWKPCNPENDLRLRRPLQRGRGSTCLPNVVEVMITLAAPSYDAPNVNGDYLRDDPRTSFRSRLEGWNIICSAAVCTGPQDLNEDHMHNNVHDWMGGQMDIPPCAVNDPMFNMHHCNVDRILESWMKRFSSRSGSYLLPPYIPASGGHPGHNRDDILVPFFPLITAGRQYSIAEDWGYTYDTLIPANIPDRMIPDCSAVVTEGSCPICDANQTCINCSAPIQNTCPPPRPSAAPSTPSAAALQENSNNSLKVGLGLGLGLGLPLVVAIAVIIALSIALVAVSRVPRRSRKQEQEVDLTELVKTEEEL